MIQVFWVVTLYRLVSGYVCFRRASYRLFQEKTPPMGVIVSTFCYSTWLKVQKMFSVLQQRYQSLKSRRKMVI